MFQPDIFFLNKTKKHFSLKGCAKYDKIEKFDWMTTAMLVQQLPQYSSKARQYLKKFTLR